jgi:hypothetical protein
VIQDDPSAGQVPEWHSLGPIDLFTRGPWQIICCVWLVGLAATVLWVRIPWLRLSTSLDPAVAFGLGSLIGWVICAPAVSRYYARTDRAMPRFIVLVGAIACGTVLLLGSTSFLRPIRAQLFECAPTVFVRESPLGKPATYAIPVSLWLLWCRFILSGFPAVDARTWVASSTMWTAYSRALRKLGVRFGAAVLAGAVCVSLALLHRTDLPPSATPEAIVRALESAPPVFFATATISQAALLARVDQARTAAEAEAQSLLFNLDLDRARPVVEAAACQLALPGSSPAESIVAAAHGFHVLDQELPTSAKSWEPSTAAVQAILKVLPLGTEALGIFPPCPLFRLSSIPVSQLRSVNDSGAMTRTQRVVTYKGTQLLDVRLASVNGPDGSAGTLEVAIRVRGVIGSDAAAAAVISRRLGAEPTEGPLSVGNGALCAVWTESSIGVRLGPAVSPDLGNKDLTPGSPLWLTCYDRSLSQLLRPLYYRRDGVVSWDPHSCHYLPRRD